MAIKIIADEGIAKSTIRLLKEAGWDVISVHEANLAGAPDPDIVEYAIKNKRIVLTLDRDFGELYYFATPKEIGIILIKAKPQTLENINEVLGNFIKSQEIKKIPLSQSLVILSKNRVRYIQKE